MAWKTACWASMPGLTTTSPSPSTCRSCRPACRPCCAAGGASTTIGPLVLDHASHSAALNGDLLDLTQREWELLELLVNRCGEVVTRDDVLAAWRASPPEPGQTAAPPLNSNALEVYVHR